MIKNNNTRLKTIIFFCCGLITIFLAGYKSFTKLDGNVFFSWDSASYIAFGNEKISSGSIFDFGPSYNQSLGNIGYPVDFWLLPEFILSFNGDRINPINFYLVTAIIFYLVAFLVTYIFGFGRWIAIMTGMLFPLITLPYVTPVIITELFWWHAPFTIPLVYMSAILIISFYITGRSNTKLNLLFCLLNVVSIVWIVSAYPKVSIVIFLGVGIFYFLFYISSIYKSKEFIFKTLLIILNLLSLYFLLPFLKNIYGFTANSIIGVETVGVDGLSFIGILNSIIHSPTTWYSLFIPNLVWVKSHSGYLLTALAITGAFTTLISKNWCKSVKIMGAGVLLVYPYAFISIYGAIYVYQIFYLLIAFSFVPLIEIWKILKSKFIKTKKLIYFIKYEYLNLIVVCVLMFIIFAGKIRVVPNGFPYPSNETNFVSFLKQKIQFNLGDNFNGRFLNLLPVEYLDKGHVNVIDNNTLMAVSAVGLRLAQEELNDMSFSNLREFNIPVTIEHNRMSNPFTVIFNNFLLVRDNDKERIDFRYITNFNEKILNMIGVKYILVTEKYIEDNRISSSVLIPSVKTNNNLRILELKNSNLGQYEPKNILYSKNIIAGLEIINNVNFKPDRDVVLNSNPIFKEHYGNLKFIKIIRSKKGLKIQAESDGPVLVVLPFEFSNCLTFINRNSYPEVDRKIIFIQRANVILTAIEFEKKIDGELVLNFGPFKDQHCRNLDLKEINRDKDYYKVLLKKYPNKFKFEGFQ